MKVRVKVEGKTFEVEIESLQSQPIIARVDGEPVEVWLESNSSAHPHTDLQNTAGIPTIQDKRNDLRAPIPGTITSIAVKAGDMVSYGQEICVLDAMKMKNPIRSPRDGEIGEVNITVGQTVKHNDLIVTFLQSDLA
jgi:glutaconyl-CoA/methylmalonyl-CoA decarboxylase subunit gamma